MQTVEIMIYIIVAIIAGTLLVHFLVQYDYEEAYDQTNQLTRAGRTLDFEVDKEQFLKDIFYYWEDCAFGEVETTYAVYINDAGELTKRDIAEYMVKLNKDTELNYENMAMSDIMLPKVVTITCKENFLKIE